MAQIILNENSVAPSTPASGELTLYAKTDNNLYTKDHLGNEVAVSSGNGITSLTGQVTASGPGAAAATVVSVGGSSAANIHAAELLANAATSANTASTIALRDAGGNFSAGTITANLTGNASGSSSSFTGSLSGDVTGHQGSTVVALVGGSSASAVNTATLTVSSATSTNTPSTLVKRDSSGNFSAGTITAGLTGDISGSAANATNIKSGFYYTNADLFPALLTATGSFEPPQAAGGFTFNPATSLLKATYINCNNLTATGTITGNLTGTASQATKIWGATEYTGAPCFPVFVDAADSWQTAGTSSHLTFNPATQTLTTGTVIANLTGNVTGNASTATNVSGTVAVANGGTGATTGLVARQNLGAETVFNGIEDASQFSITYDSTNRQFSIITTASAAYTVAGVRYVPGAGTTTTTAHANTTGQWFCYYAAGGALTVSSTPWDLLNTAPAALVYYTTSNNGGGPSSVLFYELHAGDKGMSPATHKNLHTTRGTQLLSGVAISGYTLNASGLANTSYAVSSGSIADEDIVYATSAQPQGGVNTYRIFWLTGSSVSPTWNWTDAASGGIFTNGTDVYYNQLTGGNWQLTADTAQNTYVNYWILATTTYGYPQIVVIMGQTTYPTLVAAQTATFSSEIINLGLLTQEGVIVYQMTYHRNNTYGTPGNIQLASVARITESLVAISVGSPATTAGNVVVNATTFSGRLNSSDTNVQTALQDLDTNITSIALGGTGQATASAAYNALSPMSTTGDLEYESGTNTASRLPIGTAGQVLSVVSGLPAWSTKTGSVGASISGGGAAIQPGGQGFVQIPYNATITSWSIMGDRSGSIVIDLWKVPFASFPSTVSNSITGSALPTLSSAQSATSSSLTGWTTSISAGDVITFNINSATTVQQITIELQVSKL